MKELIAFLVIAGVLILVAVAVLGKKKVEADIAAEKSELKNAAKTAEADVTSEVKKL
jgi:large-conductance mechanosensitive channel